MNKEIGGYLEWCPHSGNEYYSNLLRFNTMRSAAHFLIRQRGYKKIYIPAYLCLCMEELFNSIGIEYEYYSISEQFQPQLEHEPRKGECVYVVNYYGQLSRIDILALKQRLHNIFLDNTQDFFSPPLPGIDTAYTCRKFFGVPDGAYLSADELDLKEYQQYSRRTAALYVGHILGRFEDTAAAHYQDFMANEDALTGSPIQRMSSFSQSVLSCVDYNDALSRRENNFLFLHNRLCQQNQLTLRMGSGPFMYPLLVSDGEELRTKLIAQKIYIPKFWPGLIERSGLSDFEANLVRNLVLLPVDQRYSEGDMQYIINLIKRLRS